MELKWLEDFLSLADSGSFSRSAEQRHVSQPAFSRPAHSIGGGGSGGGALDRSTVVVLVLTLLTAVALVRVAERKRRERAAR